MVSGGIWSVVGAFFNMSGGIIIGLLLCLVLANLPWLSDRFLLLGEVLPQKKRWLWRLMQWGIYLIAAAAIMFGLERYYTGKNTEQDWELIVSALLLFIIFAFPGFIYRLYKK